MNASWMTIVIPIHVNDEIIGVLDIDAPITDRFTNEDKEGLEVIFTKCQYFLVI
jgi:L-methionine (R)-S-oxide reductase